MSSKSVLFFQFFQDFAGTAEHKKKSALQALSYIQHPYNTKGHPVTGMP
jgi:hypothetical protein